jgi:pimeloyl-ACP methyl ester carboxylesterase
MSVDFEAFTCAVPDSRIEDLRARLRNARFPDDLANEEWTYGTSRSYLQSFVQSWLEYDWRATEAEINSYDNVVTTVGGVRTHVLRKRGVGEKRIPLLLAHGWPWTFWDYREAIDLLTNPAAFGDESGISFDVVVPSLPGFGFSTPLAVDGIGTFETVDIWAEVMAGLGYERYGVAGGDFGVHLSAQLAHKYPENVIGIHTTIPFILRPAPEGQATDDPFGMVLRRLAGPTEVTPRDAFPPEDQARWDLMRSRGITTLSHLATQVVAPQTVSYGMHDSPVALAAWILERRRNWSDNDGDVEQAFSRKFLLDLVSLYWFTDSFVGSARYYFHSFRRPWRSTHPGRAVQVPVGVSVFPRELVFTPRAMAEENLDLRWWTEHPRGGHFAPSEAPEVWSQDVRGFFRQISS